MDDHEANFRYRRALDLVQDRLPKRPLQIAEIGCKFAAVRAVLGTRGIDYSYTGINLDAGSLAKVITRDNDMFIVVDADNPIACVENAEKQFVSR